MMTVQELYDILKRFIDNDFAHLKKRVDWLIVAHVGALSVLIANLILLLVRR